MRNPQSNTTMFYTPVHILRPDFQLNYEDNILTLGSCFAENIGMKLQNAYFPVLINPFGVLYNPMSVAHALRHLLTEDEFSAKDLFQHGSLWHSFAHSSVYSDTTVDGALQKINSRLIAARSFLQNTQAIMITLGTAWVFELVKNRQIVSNCHKLPSNLFNRRRLHVDEIVTELSDVISLLSVRNPEMNILFSVSPIRHWKDGAHENTLSKSVLHLSVNELVNRFTHVGYFPAFEIMMDELRDYRYYASDMQHPSSVAIDYIWQRFSDTYFSEETKALKKTLEQLRLDNTHRPLHPYTPEYEQFITEVKKKEENLSDKYPFLQGRL